VRRGRRRHLARKAVYEARAAERRQVEEGLARLRAYDREDQARPLTQSELNLLAFVPGTISVNGEELSLYEAGKYMRVSVAADGSDVIVYPAPVFRSTLPGSVRIISGNSRRQRKRGHYHAA
jgi:hypothetical protein